MRVDRQPAPHQTGEEGFLLLAAVAMVALVLVALAVAAPVIAKDLRRDKEVESMHRAQQYVRAIRLYQRKFPNQYPASIDALEKTNNIRFLRKQYVDPLTGKADWQLIHAGENKTKVSVFFGEPLGGLGTSGGSGIGGLQSTATNITTGCNATNSAFCTPDTKTSTSGTTPPNSTTTQGAASTGGNGFGNGGAGPIIGVRSSHTGESILVVNGQTTYETWEFMYDPLIELLYKKGQLGGGIGTSNTLGQGITDKSGTSNGLGNPTSPNTPAPTTTPR